MVRTAKISLGGSVLALAIVLSACGPKTAQDNAQVVSPTADASTAALPPLPAVMPMEAGPATPVRYAPAAKALPRARPLGYASVAGNDRYAWIDRADRISDTIGDAPPDYAFDYGDDGEQPYGWETAGGYRTYAEPLDDGYRYYYYDPGADEPYLVRDPDYSYGYADGRIVSIYDRGGRVLSDYEAQRQADAASRYYERARALRFASDQRQRRGVVAAQWADRRDVISRQRAQWDVARNEDTQWRSYRQEHDDDYRGDYARQLTAEREARARAAQQFAGWQGQGFRGSAPALYAARASAAQQIAQQARLQQQQRAQQAAAHQGALQQQNAQLQARQQADARAQAERQRLAAEHAQAAQQQAQTHAAALRQQQQAVAAQQRAAAQARQAQALAQQKQAREQGQQQAQQARIAQQAQQRAAAQAQQARVAQQKQALVQKQQAQQRATEQAQRARAAQVEQARAAQQQAAMAQKQAAQQRAAAEAQQARVAQQKAAQAQQQQARAAQQQQALAAKREAQQRAAAQAQQARAAQQKAALAQKQAARREHP